MSKLVQKLKSGNYDSADILEACIFLSENQALRDELATVKAENAKLNTVVCQTCHGAGSVCSAPDDCYDCPECISSINKIKADAIKDAANSVSGIDMIKYDDLIEHANQVEKGQ